MKDYSINQYDKVRVPLFITTLCISIVNVPEIFFKNHSIYLCRVKKFISGLLLLIITFNHLNLTDSMLLFSGTYHQDPVKKNFPVDEERETENEQKEKGKENEKYLGRISANIHPQYDLTGADHLTWYTTMLNKHPYAEDDIQPPKAV